MTGSATALILGILAEPLEILQTRNGKPWVKAVISVKTYRRGTNGDPGQEEETYVPINLFSGPADAAKRFLQVGDPLGVTVRISGTEFRANGGPAKRGVSLTVDQLHLIPSGKKQGGSHERSL
jgi:single-stranded DNA-binding protein